MNIRHVRPVRRTSVLIKLGYVLLVVAAATMVAKCAMDLQKQSNGAASESSENSLPVIDAKSVTATTKHESRDSSAVRNELPTDETPTDVPTIVAAPEAVSTINEPATSAAEPVVSLPLSGKAAPELPEAEAESPASSAPIHQATPLHKSMLTPGNFVYLGGFRPEFGDGMESRFGWGGLAVAYRPDGDSKGEDDGHPGSLYLSGHGQHQLVAEISIPAPFVSVDKNIDDLPVAETLQPFSDVTAGVRKRMTNGATEPFEIGGMQVVGNRLHWTLYKYYNVGGTDYPSHGLSSVNLSTQAMRGLWHLGPMHSGAPQWHSYKHAGYISDIPQAVADRHFGGRNLMSGLQISTGLQKSSQGPALFAYKIDNESLPFGESISAVPLLWYPMNDPVAQHHPADSWKGAAWLTLGDKQAVVVVGRKGLGPVHYGMPRPGDCYEDKGYHASAYETQMLFYRPEDLLASAGQAVSSVPPWFRWDSSTPGGGIDRFMYQTCKKQIGGSALDRKRNLLYVVEANAAMSEVNDYEPLPIVHVFGIVP